MCFNLLNFHPDKYMPIRIQIRRHRKITCAGINLPSGGGWGTGLCRLERRKDYLCRNKPAIRGVGGVQGCVDWRVRKITCAGINLLSGGGWGTGLWRLESWSHMRSGAAWINDRQHCSPTYNRQFIRWHASYNNEVSLTKKIQFSYFGVWSCQ